MNCCILEFLFGTNDNGVDRTALWTGVAAFAAIVAAFATILAVFVAWYELGRTRKTTRADFAKRFVESFFTGETRGLFGLLMNSALEFEVLEIKGNDGKKIDELPFFKIKKDVAHQLKGVIDAGPEKTGYSAFEIDDLLLGHLDDIGWYERHDLIDLETIREMFGYYIFECNQNKEIQKYLKERCNKGKYENFKRLAGKINDAPRS
jgi:hypothetical protein